MANLSIDVNVDFENLEEAKEAMKKAYDKGYKDGLRETGVTRIILAGDMSEARLYEPPEFTEEWKEKSGEEIIEDIKKAHKIIKGDDHDE